MKEFTRLASTALSGIPPTSPKRFFKRGLYAVHLQRITPQLEIPLLTIEEVIQVNLATIREGSSHRYWPTDVLVALLKADVIKNQA
jgi:hypothetical protein